MHLKGVSQKLRLLWCDNVYSKTAFVHPCQQRLRWRAVERLATQKGFAALPRREMVERPSAWLSHCRRLARDYERRPQSSEALIYFDMTRLMLRRLASSEF